MVNPEEVTLDDLSGEIGDAIKRYEDRKMALYESASDRPGINDDLMRTLLVGLELDLRELNVARALAASAAGKVFETALEELGGDAVTAFKHTNAGTWVDGVVTGLLIGLARNP